MSASQLQSWGTNVLYLCFAVLVLIAATYSVIARWWISTVGRTLFALVFSLLLTYGWLTADKILGIPSPVREWVRLAAYVAVFISLTALWIVMIRAQWQGRKSKPGKGS